LVNWLCNLQADEALEKSKFRTAVEAYVAALEIVPDHDLHNIKLNMGLCKALVQLGRGKDAVMRCSLVLEMDGAALEALEQVFNTAITEMLCEQVRPWGWLAPC
jgi:hypothetical protein